MSLHARNVAVAAGATDDEIDAVLAAMVQTKSVRADVAAQALARLRFDRPLTADAGSRRNVR